MPVSRASQAVAQRVDDRGEQDHAALDGEHREQRQPEQLQALVDHAEEQHAEQRPHHPALAAEQADAADHRGADRRRAGCAGRAPACRSPAARCRGSTRAPAHRPEMTKAHITARSHRHAGDRGGARVACRSRTASAPRHGAAQDQMRRRPAPRRPRRRCEGQARRRSCAFADADEARRQVADAAPSSVCTEVYQIARPAEEHHRRQRDDERRHAEAASMQTPLNRPIADPDRQERQRCRPGSANAGVQRR